MKVIYRRGLGITINNTIRSGFVESNIKLDKE